MYIIGEDETFFIDSLIYSPSGITVAVASAAVLKIGLLVEMDRFPPAENGRGMPDVAVADLV